MEKYVFTIETAEQQPEYNLGIPDVGAVINIASKEDFDAGNKNSYETPDEIREILDEVAGELMEGVWEILTDKNVDDVRKFLVSKGLIDADAKSAPATKLETKDCVAALLSHLRGTGVTDPEELNPKNWKRRSKSGTDPIIREFENETTENSAKIFSTKTEILQILTRRDELIKNLLFTVHNQNDEPWIKDSGYKLAVTAWINDPNDDQNGCQCDEEVGYQIPGLEELGLEEDAESSFAYYGSLTKQQMVEELKNLGLNASLNYSDATIKRFPRYANKNVVATPIAPTKNLITVEDLHNWMMDNGEDPIGDGPIYLKDEHEKEFISSFKKKEIEEVLDCVGKEDVDELEIEDFGIGGGSFSDKLSDKIMKTYADILNKYGYENKFVPTRPVTVTNTGGMLEFIKKDVIRYSKEEGSFTTYSWLPDFIWNLTNKKILKNWPQVDNDGDLEDLDLENNEILELNDNHMTICCGGDWQEPLNVLLKLDGKNITCENLGEGFDDGMDNGKFCEILGIKYKDDDGDVIILEETPKEEKKKKVQIVKFTKYGVVTVEKDTLLGETEEESDSPYPYVNRGIIPKGDNILVLGYGDLEPEDMIIINEDIELYARDATPDDLTEDSVIFLKVGSKYICIGGEPMDYGKNYYDDLDGDKPDREQRKKIDELVKKYNIKHVILHV